MDGYSFQSQLALWSLGLGVVLCIVYDFLRVFSINGKCHPLVLFLRDIGFCLFASVAQLLLFFNLSSGGVRFYAFVCMGIGFALWRVTVGRLFVKLMGKVICLFVDCLKSIKICAVGIYSATAQLIYTKIYCRFGVLSARNGFGITKRKEFKNER